MKIALIGATGSVGTRLLAEALRRGYQVTAIVRDPAKLSSREGLTVIRGDAAQEGALAALLKGHDAVLSAYNGRRGSPGYTDEVLTGYRAIINAARIAGARLLVVGGAGSLDAAPGLRLIDTPNFPEAYKTEALAFAELLDALRKETSLDWTLLSPSALLVPGERTGKFRLGEDRLLTDAGGESRISMEDLAVALIDEVERPRHVRRRFTVGY